MNFWETAAGHHLGEFLQNVARAVMHRCNGKQYYVTKHMPTDADVENVMKEALAKGNRLVHTIHTSNDCVVFVFEE